MLQRNWLCAILNVLFVLPLTSSSSSAICSESFDIQFNEIIRTQDSKAIGAKFLNSRDVRSREECLQLCCSTEECDVFVFEEKNPGSCYLFECGPPENFKCKFTKHNNYTSAILVINRHLTELESQIKFTQHEHELTRLREPKKESLEQTQFNATTVASKSKEIIGYGLDLANTKQPKKSCSRNQFECHTSGECIAIYNACDGIPQCADGSDESVELGCPGQSSTSDPTKPTQPPHLLVPVGGYSSEIHSDRLEAVPEPVQKTWPQHRFAEELTPVKPYSAKTQLESSNTKEELNPRINYGREGEGLSNYRQDWNAQSYRPTGGIFTHKGSGLVQPAERYPPQHYVPPDVPLRNAAAPYNEQIPNEYPKYYYDGGPYRMFPQNQGQNWNQEHKQHEISGNRQIEDNIKPEAQPNPAPDYFYEESYRRGQQPYAPQPYPNRSPQYPVNPNGAASPPKISPTAHETAKTTSTEAPTSTSTSPPKRSEEPKKSHRKIDELTAEFKSELNSLVEDEGHGVSPRGAVLSLAMGLCITTIMIVIVACRMRVVRTRTRRGGKSGFAHDADFLVNGMYL